LGTFDVRCAVTGVVIRTEDVVLFPLICTRPTTGWIIGLPRVGAYDGFGRLTAMKKSAVFDAFAQSMVTRARFPEPPPDAKRFLRRLIDLQNAAPKLGMRELGFAFVLRSVYNALISIGRTDATLIAQMRGKHRDVAGLFEAAVREHRTSLLLHEVVPPEAQKNLRVGLVALARSGLGHGDLPRVSLESCVQHAQADVDSALDDARARWAHVPAVRDALSAYAAERV
jgi:hypothetical protein